MSGAIQKALGEVEGLKAFAHNLPLEDAKAERIKALASEVEELKAKLAAAPIGEDEPVTPSEEPVDPAADMEARTLGEGTAKLAAKYRRDGVKGQS